MPRAVVDDPVPGGERAELHPPAGVRALLLGEGPPASGRGDEGDERRAWNFVPGEYAGLALGAMGLPARRAASLDPAETLRAD